MLDNEQSLSFISPSSENARGTKPETNMFLSSQEPIYSITSNLTYSLK